MSVSEHRLLPKPAWIGRVERRLAERIPLHPNLISAAKLVIVAPALLLSIGHPIVVLWFVLFGVLDYLDGVVARERGLATAFGRVFDRVTDYPLIVGLSYVCVDVFPWSLVALKVALDLLLLVLFVLGKGSTENRVRTALSYATLFGLLALSQGWPGFTAPRVVAVLLANVALTTAVAAYNLGLLRKRRIADLLSFGNLVCGGLAIAAASQGRYGVSLVLLLLGAGFDGFDGAAARRWGGSRFGVLADDAADAVNFGLAPGALVAFALGGIEGAVIGGVYAACTIARLVYFTLNKADADPRHFAGVPSPAGALLTTCAVVLLHHSPLAVGFIVGVSCTLMVSFSTPYLHLGRWLAERRARLAAVPVLALALLALGVALGPKAPAAVLLVGVLLYGAQPAARSFRRVMG